MMTRNHRAEEIFADAESLYREAIEELDRGKVRDAAEKAWGATVRATNALILARTGREMEGARGTTKELDRLAGDDKEIDERIIGRYFIRESSLHGHCFYMGICEPRDRVERRIRETKEYIEDAKNLAKVG
jgi:uncharacterized protein (UPF0332 family)